MAKLELRDTIIYLQDGLAGTGAVNDVAGLLPAATDVDIDTLVLNNTDAGDLVPIGARFTVAGETVQTVHTVTARVGGTGTTTNITFTPAIGAGTMADGAVITFLPIRLEIKVGDGNLTYTEARELTYELDRGTLDTVREGDDQPVAVNIQFVYEHVRTGTGELCSPVDGLKGIGGAAEWISSDQDDNCAPYAVDMIIEHTPACSGQSVETETTTFENFRYDNLQFDLSAASIAVTGRCNSTEATVARS